MDLSAWWWWPLFSLNDLVVLVECSLVLLAIVVVQRLVMLQRA